MPLYLGCESWKKKKPPLMVRQHPGADINEISNCGFPLGVIKAQMEGKVKMCMKKILPRPGFPERGVDSNTSGTQRRESRLVAQPAPG